MRSEEKARELARKHQGTMTDAQYLQMVYALEEMDSWKDEQFEQEKEALIDKARKFFTSANRGQLCRQFESFMREDNPL